MKKELDALNTLKLLSFLAGIGFAIFGLLEFLWNDQTIIGGIFILEGVFKLGIGNYLSNYLKCKKTSSNQDEDDEDDED